jgi:hypothetical protein
VGDFGLENARCVISPGFVRSPCCLSLSLVRASQYGLVEFLCSYFLIYSITNQTFLLTSPRLPEPLYHGKVHKVLLRSYALPKLHPVYSPAELRVADGKPSESPQDISFQGVDVSKGWKQEESIWMQHS